MFTFSSNHWEWDGRCMWETDFYVYVSWNDVFVTQKDRRLGFWMELSLTSTQSVSWRQIKSDYDRCVTSSTTHLRVSDYKRTCICDHRVWRSVRTPRIYRSVTEDEYVRIHGRRFFFLSCLVSREHKHSRTVEYDWVCQ